MKKRLCALLAALLALLLLSSCASHGKTLIEAEGEEISVHVYQLYLSRMKGALAEAGNAVTTDAYWNTYISTDHTTTADYYNRQVLDGLKHIAAAMILYEEYGLSLPDGTKAEIDAWIDGLIESDGGGSRTTLDSILSGYGANTTTLRDAAILEAKLAQLKEYLYGSGGSLIADTALEQYYKATYYRGYQLQLANYYYDHEKDPDGFAVRYTDSTYKQIAYVTDTEDSSVIKVANTGAYLEKYGAAYGEYLYLYREGDTEIIAYDKDDGVIKYKYGSDGERVMKEYTEQEMQARYDRALEIAELCAGKEELFLQYMRDYSDSSDFNATYAPNGMYFSVGTFSADTVFGTFSAELVKLEIGATAVLTSDSGYYILMRAPLDTGAWQKEENARWFSTLRGLTLEYMLQQRTAAYLDRVTVDEALLADISIAHLGSNVRY